MQYRVEHLLELIAKQCLYPCLFCKTASSILSINVCIEDIGARRRVLKGASSLKAKRDYEKVYIVPDLTRKQMDEDRQLREKVKQFRQDGKLGVKIVRGEVVHDVGGNREVLFSISH
jgi:hypothetical protein